MQTITVNQSGLEFIAQVLKESHVREEPFTLSMLAAWASDVENSWAEGNGAGFEIPARESVTGNPIEVTMPAGTYDVIEIDEE